MLPRHTPVEIEQGWTYFQGGPVQSDLHDFLHERISQAHRSLEGCSPSDLAKFQASIAEARALLAKIHEKDTAAVKKLYA